MTTEQQQTILQIGDPRLRQLSRAVVEFDHPTVIADSKRVHQALQDFRQQYSFGRATAAPQLAIHRRIIAIHLPGWPDIIINPEITWRSADQISLWDDCMCFPFLLVRVQRAVSISLRFQDHTGSYFERERLETATAELLQHEIDHLDGILATDRAIDKDALVSRDTFNQSRDFFVQQVNFTPND